MGLIPGETLGSFRRPREIVAVDDSRIGLQFHQDCGRRGVVIHGYYSCINIDGSRTCSLDSTRAIFFDMTCFQYIIRCINFCAATVLPFCHFVVGTRGRRSGYDIYTQLWRSIARVDLTIQKHGRSRIQGGKCTHDVVGEQPGIMCNQINVLGVSRFPTESGAITTTGVNMSIGVAYGR